MTEAPINIFISYSHDSDVHRERVLGLAQQLRSDGLESHVDQFLLGGPPQGWPRWMLHGIEAARFVLVVCSATYRRRLEGREQPEVGAGVDWEGIMVMQQLYDSRSINRKFVPVLLGDATQDDVPQCLKPFKSYRLPDEYEHLYRYITDQPEIIPQAVGTWRKLAPRPS